MMNSNDSTKNSSRNRTRLSENTAKKPARRRPRRVTESWLHNSGLYYLQRFSASRAGFREVMMRKVDRSCRFHNDQDRAECARMVDALVEKFTGLGLLDDETYARASVTTLRRRGFSARAIAARLRDKGLGPEQIAAALSLVDEENNDGDVEAALRLARRKRIGPFRRAGAPDDDNLAQKEMAALARAGYSYETVRKVLAMESGEAARVIEDPSAPA